uniref:PWI domain-containing protein n=1 Tax=Tetraselmis sp. GSL018 TaxID=582737 RepID=A0A061SI83_9CHLO
MSSLRQPFGRGQFQAVAVKSSKKKVKLPDVYGASVDTVKIKLPVVKAWAIERLAKDMGYEDEIAQAQLFDCLDKQHPNPLDLETGLTGLVADDILRKFVEELWKLLVEAQKNPSGVPPVRIHNLRFACPIGLARPRWLQDSVSRIAML